MSFGEHRSSHLTQVRIFEFSINSSLHFSEQHGWQYFVAGLIHSNSSAQNSQRFDLLHHTHVTAWIDRQSMLQPKQRKKSGLSLHTGQRSTSSAPIHLTHWLLSSELPSSMSSISTSVCLCGESQLFYNVCFIPSLNLVQHVCEVRKSRIWMFLWWLASLF